MNERLNSILEKGEELRFATKTEKFETMDKTNKGSQMTKLIISLLVTIAIIAGYIIRASSSGIDLKWGVIAVLGLLGVYIAFSDIISARKVAKMEYALTDRRLIIMTDPEKSIPLKDIKDYEFKTDNDGHVTLLLGKEAIKSPAKRWRVMPIGPIDKEETSEQIRKFALYAIDDAKKFERVFREAMAEL